MCGVRRPQCAREEKKSGKSARKLTSHLTCGLRRRNMQLYMVKCSVTYQGELHCALGHGPSGAQVSTDAPVDNHGKGESFSPTDLMCAATGACMSTIMGIYAQEHALDLRGMRVEVGKEMSANPRRIARITVDIHVPLPSDTPHRAALEQCATGSPAMHSLHPDIEVPITWHWEG